MAPSNSPTPRHLLVVDANPGSRAFLQENLEKEGFETTVVPYGAHALELLQKDSYDLVLVDQELPDFEGIELSTKMKQLYPDMITILMVTAAAEADEDQRSGSVDARLSKPFDAAELLQLIHRHIQPEEPTEQAAAAAALVPGNDVEKNRFFHEVAHQLKTPIVVLKEFAHLFKEGFGGELTDKQGQYMEAIDRNIERLLYLVDNIDQLSRTETGSWSIRLEPADPVEIVRRVADSWRSVLEKSDFRLVTEITEELPPIDADIMALEQVLFNLMDNARKYGPRDSSIILRCALSGDDTVCIEVEDRGKTIPEEDREAVFQPYKRLTEQQASAGLGLGLTVARDLVRRMGGDLSLEPGTEAGNRFCLQLRVARATD